MNFLPSCTENGTIELSRKSSGHLIKFGLMAGTLNMHVLTFTEARSSFKSALDDVCRDHQPLLITRKRGEHAVLLSLEDYNGMLETMHLLSSSKNAKRLAESIADFQSGATSLKSLEIPLNVESKGESQE